VTQKVHHQTERAADMALAKKQISQESYEAVLAGTLTLAEARKLGGARASHDTGQASSGREEGRKTSLEGREHPQAGTGAPPQPISRISKEDRSRLCMCACGTRTKGGRFAPGHDVRMVSYAKEYLQGERKLTDEQMTYVRDSGKLERARTRLAEEERRRREQAARKAERHAKAQTKDEK
jgi:hypothetical protein